MWKWQVVSTIVTSSTFQTVLLDSFQIYVSSKEIHISKRFLRSGPYLKHYTHMRTCTHFFPNFSSPAGCKRPGICCYSLKSGCLRKSPFFFFPYAPSCQCHPWKLISSRSCVGYLQMSFKKENKKSFMTLSQASWLAELMHYYRKLSFHFSK